MISIMKCELKGNNDAGQQYSGGNIDPIVIVHRLVCFFLVCVGEKWWKRCGGPNLIISISKHTKQSTDGHEKKT